jgi:hypothetical protein
MEEDFISVNDVRKITDTANAQQKEKKKAEVKATDLYKKIESEIYAVANKGQHTLKVYPKGLLEDEMQELWDNTDITVIPAKNKTFTDEDAEILNSFAEYGGFSVGLQSVSMLYKDNVSMDNIQYITIRW